MSCGNDLLKRKRSIDGAGTTDLPPAKRTSSQTLVLDDKIIEKLRNDVKRVYISYDKIINSSNVEHDESAFQAVLDAAQGDCPSRRLAARLIPRWIASFPQHADTAAALLVDLHDFRQPCAFSTPQLVDAIKRDALQGLGRVLDAAQQLAPKDAPIVRRLVDYLLRLLGDPGGNDADGDDDVVEEGELDDRGSILGLLHQAFHAHPATVLGACLQAIRGSEALASSGASLLLHRHLLRPRPLAHAAAAAAARDANGSGGAPTCVAGDAVASSAELQQWVQTQADRLRRDPSAPRPYRAAIDALCALLPAGATAAAQSTARSSGGGAGAKPLAPLTREGSNGRLPRNGSTSSPPADDHLRERRSLFPPPGGDVCPAEPCLWFSGLPSGWGRADLAARLGAASAPLGVHLLEGPPSDEACAVFAAVRDAALCYEAIAGRPLLPHARPLRVQFCGGLPRHTPHGQLPPPTRQVWVAGALDSDRAALLVGTLQAAGLPAPVEIKVVRGEAPGCLLILPPGTAATTAADALRRRLLPAASALPPGAGPTPPGPPTPAAAPALSAALSSDPPSPGAGAPPPRPAPSLPPLQPPPPGATALILCNLDHAVRDGEVQKTAERFGLLKGYRPNRIAETAFLEFVSPGDATRAAHGLHGALLGRKPLVVEWAPLRGDAPLPPLSGARMGGGGGGGHLPGPPPLPVAGVREPRWDRGGGGGGASAGSGGPVPSSRWDTPPLPTGVIGRGGGAQGPSSRWDAAPAMAGAIGAKYAQPPPQHQQQPHPQHQQPPPQQPQQQPHQQQPPHQPLEAGGGAPPWVGRVHKTNISPFQLACVGAGGGGTPHPVVAPPGWPPELHVKERVAVPSVLDCWHNAARDGQARGAWRLVASRPDDGAGLAAFSRYLSEKQRAGVVKLPAAGQLPARSMYLLTPSDALCRELMLAWAPPAMLVAVVLVARQ